MRVPRESVVKLKRALDLVENEEFHFALELTRQAIRADPRAEYFALLGRIQVFSTYEAGNESEREERVLHERLPLFDTTRAHRKGDAR